MDYKILNQEFIDYLIKLDKLFEDEGIRPATNGENKNFKLTSSDGRCLFSLDMNRGGTIEYKVTLQTRYLATNDWIIRFDINGPPHTNSDGFVTDRDHIHILKEEDGNILNMGYNIDEFHNILIANTKNINNVFEEFCKFCNIEIPSDYQIVL